jgi:hypothetical protein
MTPTCYLVSDPYFWGSVSFAVNTCAPVQAKITRAICGNQVERAVTELPHPASLKLLGGSEIMTLGAISVEAPVAPGAGVAEITYGGPELINTTSTQ